MALDLGTLPVCSVVLSLTASTPLCTSLNIAFTYYAWILNKYAGFISLCFEGQRLPPRSVYRTRSSLESPDVLLRPGLDDIVLAPQIGPLPSHDVNGLPATYRLSMSPLR